MNFKLELKVRFKCAKIKQIAEKSKKKEGKIDSRTQITLIRRICADV